MGWQELVVELFGEQAAFWVIGVVVLGGLVWRVRKKTKPWLAKIRTFLIDWEGEPARPEAGVAERPGMMRRVSNLETGLAKVQQEVTPNHGSSAHDKLRRTINKVDSKVDALFAHLGIEPPDIAPDPPEPTV